MCATKKSTLVHAINGKQNFITMRALADASHSRMAVVKEVEINSIPIQSANRFARVTWSQSKRPPPIKVYQIVTAWLENSTIIFSPCILPHWNHSNLSATGRSGLVQ